MSQKRTLHSFFSGSASSSSGAKKSRSSNANANANANATSSTSSSATSTPRPIFLICPGASGSLPRDGNLERGLGSLGRVVTIPKSSGYNGKIGCTSTPGSRGALNANLRIICDALRQELSSLESLDNNGETKTPVVLVGQSFGCRAIVHFLTATHEVRRPPSLPLPWPSSARPADYQTLQQRVTCAVLFGYPLSHPTQDRSAALKQLAFPNRAIFVMGTADRQSLGSDCSQSNFENVLEEMTAATELVWVERGGHGPPNGSRWNEAGLTTKLRRFVEGSVRASRGRTLGGAEIEKEGGDGDEVKKGNRGDQKKGRGKGGAVTSPEEMRAKRLAALDGNQAAGGDCDDDGDQKIKSK